MRSHQTRYNRVKAGTELKGSNCFSATRIYRPIFYSTNRQNDVTDLLTPLDGEVRLHHFR